VELYAFEDVISSGWSTVVQVGLAMAQIRDRRLYRGEFHSFEAYCKVKWQYGRNYIDRLICAAQVFTCLMTNCHENKPEHESQVRPLIGLTPEEATRAWAHAVEKAGARRITAAIVKSAIRDLQLGKPENAAYKQSPRVNQAAQRRLIDQAVGELILLLGQKANHSILSQKVEALYEHIQGLFPRAGMKNA